MKIIVEGSDNAGKTTLIHYLSRMLGMPIVIGEGPPKSVEEINDRVDRYHEKEGHIFDRHPCVSNAIYDLFRREPLPVSLDRMDRFYADDVVFIYCQGRDLDGHVTKIGEHETADHVVNVVQRHHADIVRAYEAWGQTYADIVYRVGKTPMRRVAEFLAGNTQLHNKFDVVSDMEEFHAKFGLFYDGLPRQLDDHLADFRRKFMQEEIDEYQVSVEAVQHVRSMFPDVPDQAEYTFQLCQQMDALIDLVYVAVGTAHLQGFDFREGWRRVHAANMKKVRASSAADSKRGSSFDVVKPPFWEAPDHTDLCEVNDQSNRDK